MVERPLRMRKASGSIPDISTRFAGLFLSERQNEEEMGQIEGEKKNCWA